MAEAFIVRRDSLSSNLSMADVLETVFPIGAIYLSMSSTSPAELFGGTWSQIKSRFLMGSGVLDDSNTRTQFGTAPTNFYDFTAGETMGEFKHTLTEQEMPAHIHYVNGRTWGWASDFTDVTEGVNQDVVPSSNLTKGNRLVTSLEYASTFSTGSSLSHSQVPPALVVNMWKRIA